MLTQKEVLDYEVRSSVIAGFVGWNWLQILVGKFYAFRVRRKYKRYYDSKKVEKRMLDSGLGKNARLRDAVDLQHFIVSVFQGRVPAKRLAASHSNFSWIGRNVLLTAEERRQVVCAIRLCQTLGL